MLLGRVAVGAQELPKLLHGETHSGLDCPERFLKHGGDFGLRKPSEVRKLDRAPLCHWQVLKRPPHRFAGLCKCSFMGGITIWRFGSCQNDVDVIVLPPGAASTKFVNRTVMGDG